MQVSQQVGISSLQGRTGHLSMPMVPHERGWQQWLWSGENPFGRVIESSQNYCPNEQITVGVPAGPKAMPGPEGHPHDFARAVQTCKSYNALAQAAPKKHHSFEPMHMCTQLHYS